MTDYTILARNADLSIAGILPAWTLDAQLNLNSPGSLSLTIPAEKCPPGWPSFGTNSKGNAVPNPFGVVILRNGKVWASGTISSQTDDWTADAGQGTWSFTFETDMALLGYRVIFPDPTLEWDHQKDTSLDDSDPKASHYTYSGNAETALRLLADVSVGAGAIAARRVPGFTLGTVAGVGSNVKVSERFSNLLTAMQSYAVAGGNLIFDVTDDLAQHLVFSVRAPADRTATVRFSPEFGNLTELHSTTSAPTATSALIAGGGTGKNRVTYIQNATDLGTAWGRREVFVDQRQVDPADADASTQYAQAATDALQQGTAQSTVSAVTVDTPACLYGVHYNLGDKVAVSRKDRTYTDVVSGVQVSVDESGVETVQPSIGNDPSSTGDATYDQLIALTKRVAYLESADTTYTVTTP